MRDTLAPDVEALSVGLKGLDLGLTHGGAQLEVESFEVCQSTQRTQVSQETISVVNTPTQAERCEVFQSLQWTQVTHGGAVSEVEVALDFVPSLFVADSY